MGRNDTRGSLSHSLEKWHGRLVHEITGETPVPRKQPQFSI